MKTWYTEIKAIDPKDGIVKSWGGDNIKAISLKDAINILNSTGRGYMDVKGELICEIPCKENSFVPDFLNMIDYDKPQKN